MKIDIKYESNKSIVIECYKCGGYVKHQKITATTEGVKTKLLKCNKCGIIRVRGVENAKTF